MYILSLAAAFPLGGAVSACMYCLSKMLMDEPGFCMYDFRRKLKENLSQAAFLGIITVAFVYGQIYLWAGLLSDTTAIEYGTALLLITSAAAFEMVYPYVFLQIAHLELGIADILKNSVILAVKNLPRSFAATIVGRLIFIIFMLYLPSSLWCTPVLLIIGFSFSRLLSLMWVWPLLDEVFGISRTIKETRERELRDVERVFSGD